MYVVTWKRYVAYSLSFSVALFWESRWRWIILALCSVLPCVASHTSVIICPSVEPPDFGKATASHDLSIVASTLSFTCQTGFEVMGDKVLTCMDNGTYDAPVPLCQGERWWNGVIIHTFPINQEHVRKGWVHSDIIIFFLLTNYLFHCTHLKMNSFLIQYFGC